MSTEHSSPARPRLLVEQAIDDAMEDLAQRNEVRLQRDAVAVLSTRERWARIGLVIASPVLAGLVIWNVTSTRVMAERLILPAMTREEVEAEVRAVVDDIEAFKADYGELPASLAEVGLPTEGVWRYTRVADGRYRVDATLGGQAVSVDGN
jgi:hypothetical protein